MEGNTGLRVRFTVRFSFLLIYFELAPTDPWCNMLLDFTCTETIWGGNVRSTSSINEILTPLIFFHLLRLFFMGIKSLHVTLRNVDTSLLKQLPRHLFEDRNNKYSLDLLSILYSHHIKSRATTRLCF